MKKYLTLILLLLLTYIGSAQEKVPAANASTKNLKKHLYYLASDALKGRNTGSEGQRAAAAYIARCFGEYGLTPTGKDAASPFYQSFSLYQVPAESHLRASATLKGTTTKVYMLTDLLVLTGQGFGDTEIIPYKGPMEAADKSGHTPVVEAQTLSEGLDRIVEACRGEVKGTFLLSLPNRKMMELRQMRFIASTLLTLSANAAGDTVYTSIFGKSVVANESEYFHKVLPLLAKHPKLNIILTDEQLLKKLFTEKTAGADAESGVQVGKTIELKGRISADKLTRMDTENVVGIIEGTSNKDEAVILCAHYDHVGVKRQRGKNADAQADSICNGADDNASGTSAIIEAARLLAEAKKQGYAPKRTIVVTTFTAEELGLIGSKYMSENPIVPLSQVKAVLNLDMVGRTDNAHAELDMYVYPLVLADSTGHLNRILRQSAKQANIDIDSPISDNDRNLWTNGSDHRSFVAKGIPAVVLHTGLHPDYHTPADEADKISYRRLTRITSFAFYTIWMLANE